MMPPAFVEALSDRYRVQRELGAGGMATVYLARDVRHDRDVAVKVLKDGVAALIGVERFLAEIRTTARLKHPHILPLFDSGSADGTLYYVMPFVDGESLRQRLRRAGPLPIDDATRILRQVADALAHAHAHGVIHRDVKIDNVLVADGQAFLADFGIARVFAPQDPGATLTRTGVAVGTPNYMAPEQLVGGTVDQRTDIYAFGALAYELLTGAPPFDGTLQEVAQAHLTQRPAPLSSRRPDAPAPLAALVDRCLEKEPASRPARADDLVRALDPRVALESASRPRRWRMIAVALVTAVAAIVVAAVIASRRRAPADTTPALSVGRLTRLTADPGLELDPSISPDGRMIAYAAGPPGHMRVFVKELAAGGRAVPLADENADDSQRWPQWSPDGARIVFEAGRPSVVSQRILTAGLGSLFVGTPLGGTARKLAVRVGEGLASSPSWSPDGSEIAFGTGQALYAMAVDGSSPPRQLAAGLDLHSPRWSPDGTTIAYVSAASVFTFGADNLGNVGNSTLMALPLATGKSVKITDGNALDTNPVWLPDSRTLLFVSSRGGGRDVYAMPLGPDGRPESAPERLTSGASAHGIAVSRGGNLLLYSAYAATVNIFSIPIPSTGSVSVAEAEPVTTGTAKIEKLTISKDGRWIAYDSDVNGLADVWKMPLGGGRPEQVTHGPNHNFVNGWSPDGTELVFHSIVDGQRDVFVVSADGTRVERVTASRDEEQHAGWGADGNSIVYDTTPAAGGRSQAFIVTRAKPGAPWSAPRQLTKNGSTDPKWSPDGRLIAFCAGGQLRVIAPDGSGERVLVDGHARQDHDPQYAIWSPDGRMLFYKAYDAARNSSIWTVPVAGGESRLLVRFDVPSRRSVRREFDTDGRRFYFTVQRDESDIWSLELVRK